MAVNINNKIIKSKGFTLLELMVAMGILVFFISVILISFITCNLSIQTNHNLVIASSDAQFVLEQIKKIPFNEISSYSPPEFDHLNNETVTLNINNISTSIKAITVNVSWYERQKQRVFSLTTYRHRSQ